MKTQFNFRLSLRRWQQLRREAASGRRSAEAVAERAVIAFLMRPREERERMIAALPQKKAGRPLRIAAEKFIRRQLEENR